MDLFFNHFIHFLLIVFFAIIYIIAFIIIKPFLLNRKRLFSTLYLKLTYFLYLALLFICIYLFMFFGPKEFEYQTSDLKFLLLLVTLFIPNISILIRRKFQKHRTTFNILSGSINIVIFAYLLFKLINNNWFIFQ